jgi:hypothetical protein
VLAASGRLSEIEDFREACHKRKLTSWGTLAPVRAADEITMSASPGFDQLLNTVAELERLGKSRMKAMQGIEEPCGCSCHTDASIVHIGPLCCERTLAD